MKTTRMQSRRSNPAARRWWAAPASLLATLLALPVNAAIDIPDDPLTTAARVAPNILFILDDSGSMAFETMPNEQVPTVCVRNSKGNCVSGGNITDNTYIGNTLYYNPAVTYQAWMKADGNRMTGGTSYNAAYGSFNLVGGTTIDLADSGSCQTFNRNNNATNDETSSGTNVCGGVQVFYVPKDLSNETAAYLRDGRNYYRYQISAGGTEVQRGVWGTIVESGSTSIAVNANSGSVRYNMINTHTISGVPAGKLLRLEIESENSRHARYNVTDPTGLNVCTLEFGDSETRYCQIRPTVAGTYTIKVADAYPDGNWSNYEFRAWHLVTNACDGIGSGDGWIDCKPSLPNASRNLAAELTNYATWFSYHRTRMKAAKAGASDAFGPLDSKVRVGFRTIWERGASHSKPIPVDDGNDGRFVDNPDDPNTAGNESTTTRSTWYSRLQGAIGYNGTPLHGALDKAGQYFSDASPTGPYGPQATVDQYSCRQNFAILTTDGYWNNSSNYSGSLSGGSWSGGVGEQDNTAGSKILGPNGKSFTYSPTAPYRSSDSGTLADVAMKYWKTDLRGSDNSELTNNVPSTDANPAFWQHMVTFGISIGLAGTSGWNSIEEVPASATWNNPNNTEDADRIDDLLHAAVNGHGAFVSASNPSQFTAGLAKALDTIAQRTSSYSNVATNAASLRTGGMVFNASYVSGTWTGSVKAWKLTDERVPGAEAWSATIPSARKVFTFNGTSGATFPTSAQEATLARTGGPVNYPVTGAENASYIKGDQSKEQSNGGLLRNRASVLGDIVNSSPAYVDDTKTLYVGANDGMLHAFNSETGVEQFAYVPGIINFSYLATLSRGDYGHKYFVDGPIVVTNRKLTPGKNLLVGALGRGGKGLYGLDVSTPGSFSASDVEWELAETPKGNMGLVLGRPILTKVRTGATAAVLGNGVNSASGKAVLIVVNLETGAVIGEIDTGAGSPTAPNALSAPTGVLGPDGKSLAYAYAGDLQGNVWKFDLTSSTPGSWKATKLFTAVSDVTGKAQPITGGVTVALDPRTYRRWVLFGTGSYMTVADAEDKTPLAQSMYGIIDSDTAVAYADLQKRQIINTGASQDGYPVRTFEAKASLPSGKKGWYVNLPADGERIVQDAQMVSNILVTASMLPTGDACEATGSGYINAVDAFTGTSAGKSFFDLDGDGDTSDTNIGGVPVGSVNFGVGMPTLPIFLDGSLIVGGTGGAEKPVPGGIVRKEWSSVSWREIKGD